MTDATARWTKATKYADMWIDPGEDPRAKPATGTDERSVLLDYLSRYRLTLEMKCADLDAAQLASRSVPPSTMSLLGMVRHMAEVERSWFRRVMDRQDAPPLYSTDAARDADWDGAVADEAVVAQAWQAWRDEVTFAEEYLARTPDLATMGDRHGKPLPLRDILVHMIEEYARHCGHADLLRECIDGRIGQ
ncbi:DinB family protein [Jatrophihabitans telluris]|uniref:DinB family protein n=1 Tax=Jatrophihabitans telluris TaxID=2038343 RepID=A0ABY4QZB3_9ACTN|nr:DinB family protein [Jatrophihabitans telluris]UQX88663.1 DinB family protein [Jatrophihabitans telluris]